MSFNRFVFVLSSMMVLTLFAFSCEDDINPNPDDDCYDAELYDRMKADFSEYPYLANAGENAFYGNEQLFCNDTDKCHLDSTFMFGVTKNTTLELNFNDPGVICQENRTVSDVSLYQNFSTKFGVLDLAGSTLTYTPNQDFVGEDACTIILKGTGLNNSGNQINFWYTNTLILKVE